MTESIISLISLKSLGIVADLGSIIGVIASLIVLYEVKAIRKHYKFKARSPEILSRLQKHSTTINDMLRTYKDSTKNIEIEIVRTVSLLESLRDILGEKDKSSILGLISRSAAVRNIQQNEESEKAVWEFYRDLQGVIEQVTNIQQDRNWEQ